MHEAWYVPYEASLLQGRRVLVLAPHPDDEVFGCGGTLSLMAAQGADIQVVVATTGADGSIRQAESTLAAELLGYPTPDFLDFEDRHLGERGESVIAMLVERLNAHRADLLLAPSLWEMHPDHRAACDAALQAAQRYRAESQASLSVALYEVGVPLVVNQFVDITSVEHLKQRAMQCFSSQLAEQAYDRQIAGLNAYRSYTLGLRVTAAEAFHVVDPDWAKLPAALPSIQDQALWRCEQALEAARHHETDHHEAKQRQAALEHELHAVLNSRRWRWATRLCRLLGR